MQHAYIHMYMCIYICVYKCAYIYVLICLSACTDFPYTLPPFVPFGRFFILHPVSVQSCCRSGLAGRPTLARPCKGIHRKISLLSLPLLLQQCPACLVRLILIVFAMSGSCMYSSINATASWEKLRFISSDRSDFHMTDRLSLASRVLMSFSVDEMLIPR